MIGGIMSKKITSKLSSNKTKQGIDLNNLIIKIRDKQVILDSDLANIFKVETRVLIQTFKRNVKRFPSEFAFQLVDKEYSNLRSQIVISSLHGGRRYQPYVFTEHGVVMMANLLNSQIAIEASILIVKAFIRLRKMIVDFEEVYKKIQKLEEKDLLHDEQLKVILQTLKKLIEFKSSKKRKIGFNIHE
jgi:hypothetical protein